MITLARTYWKLLLFSLFIFLIIDVGLFQLLQTKLFNPWTEITIGLWSLLTNIVLAIVAALFIIKQMKDEREETRRVKTIEILQWLASTFEQHPQWTTSRDIIDNLTKEQCVLLNMEHTLSISDKIKERVEKQMSVCEVKKQNWGKKNGFGEYTLPYIYAAKLRKDAVNYLNVLETVASAWQTSIVCKEDIEKQMGYLYDKDGGAVLNNFRKAIGENSYPNLKLLLLQLKKINSNTLKSKAILN